MAIQSSPTKKTQHLVIRGRVQGVFFRNSMQREAQDLAITGWVRNRSDGAVEAMVQGEFEAVDALVRWAERGPTLADVEQIEIEQGDGNYSSFEITD
jgi:acylphosphatase